MNMDPACREGTYAQDIHSLFIALSEAEAHEEGKALPGLISGSIGRYR
jgi:hypothetical protein